jgi:hypothetical protein
MQRGAHKIGAMHRDGTALGAALGGYVLMHDADASEFLCKKV